MKRLFAISISILIIFGCSSQNKDTNKSDDQTKANNTLSKEEIAEGWQLLFDGKSMNDWRGIGIEGIPTGHWKIENGAIRKIASGNVPKMSDGQPQKGGDLISKETFKNYELKFEWKISEAGNSGVKYNVVEENSLKGGSKNALGFEYQVLDDEKHSDNVNSSHRSAALYDLIATKGAVTLPIGKYNAAKIVFNKNHGEHWLNGVKVVEYELDSPEFDKLFKKSKYRDIADFTKHQIAHIVLQDHGNDCWYRNIKIRTLD